MIELPQTDRSPSMKAIPDNTYPTINNNIPIKKEITKKKQRLIFIPIVLGIYTMMTAVWYYYLRYAYLSPDDIYYSQFFIIFLWTITVITYLLSVFTSPLQTNVNQFFSNTNSILTIDVNQPGKEIKNLNPFNWNDCLLCQGKKFIRSSHCRICKTCILFRDHHCPWIANCVGFKNIQYFINFCFWVLISLGWYMYTYILFTWNYSTIKEKNAEGITINWWIFTLISIHTLIALLCFSSILGILFNILVSVYNNKSYIESIRRIFLESYTPFNCFKADNTLREHNQYNIGFLSHFYYLIGPSLFHFFFPIPKYGTFVLAEHTPIFRMSKQPPKLEIVKYLMKIDPKYENILNNRENEPDYFIKLCHKYYDNKEIV